jgi:hypothetical protein
MLRNALFASVIALAAAGAGATQAQAPDTTGLAVPAAGNAVGGAVATIVGGGDNLVVLYSGGGAGPGGAVQTQAPRLARARNGYGGVSVDYLEPETAPPGREAWMVGGGDNAQVVYGDPRR